jgi:transposase
MRSARGWSAGRRRKTGQALALRANIVLAAAEGLSNSEIAERLGGSRPTVTKWRNRFSQRRLEGLLDEPRPGRPRTVSDEQVETIVITTLESAPKDATHWSTRSLAAKLGVSQNSVWRTWQAFGLQPHRQEKFKLSTDPLFVEKVYDICGLYLNPARARGGLVHGREEPDPSAGPHRADPADASRHTATRHPRL